MFTSLVRVSSSNTNEQLLNEPEKNAENEEKIEKTEYMWKRSKKEKKRANIRCMESKKCSRAREQNE